MDSGSGQCVSDERLRETEQKGLFLQSSDWSMVMHSTALQYHMVYSQNDHFSSCLQDFIII